jgi:hypothetical protein
MVANDRNRLTLMLVASSMILTMAIGRAPDFRLGAQGAATGMPFSESGFLRDRAPGQ